MIRSFSIVAGLAMAAGLAACAATSAPDAPPVDESLAPAPLNPLPTDLTGYLAEGDLNGAALLGPPPTPQSLTGQADRARYGAVVAAARSFATDAVAGFVGELREAGVEQPTRVLGPLIRSAVESALAASPDGP